MSDKNFVELSFRFRPQVHTPDGVLVRYLLSKKPKQRRSMILNALRTFYLFSAYGYLGDFDNLEQASEFIQVLKKIYGEGNSNIVNDSLSLNIDLRIDYMGSSLLSDFESDEDEDEDQDD